MALFNRNRSAGFRKACRRNAGSDPNRGYGWSKTPLAEIRAMYADALRVPEPPAPIRTLADMTPEEIAALERQYGAKVKR